MFTIDNLYNAVAQIETGYEKNPFIRNKTKNGSTAYGPVQLTGLLMADYLNRRKELFTNEEINYLQRFTNQAGLFIKYSNTDNKQFNYGGSGYLTNNTDKVLYKQVAEKIIADTYNRSNKDINLFANRWRGKKEKMYSEKLVNFLLASQP